MVFSSLIFLCGFLPIALFLYFISLKILGLKAGNVCLLILSLFFMFWGSGRDIIVLFSIVLINYLAGLLMTLKTPNLKIQKDRRTATQKLILWSAITISLGILFYFKYAGFIINTSASFLSLFDISIDVPQRFSHIILPLGISFYTFQALSYTIDVYFGNVESTRNPLDFSLYVVLFPQIIAGPIVRYKDIYRQINDRRISNIGVYQGVKRFLVGIIKKVLLANTVAIAADGIFNLPIEEIHFSLAWAGVAAYTLQIFLDFSAYSDMAIGLAKIFGFDLLENFNYPYISKSIKEFWRRWHISLSAWFKDYLYIPMGGNRNGQARTYINLIIVFLLCGLWHGAAWVFIIWGLWHGLFLVLERLGLGKLLNKAPATLRIIYTLVVVMIGWVFFRSPSVLFALAYLKRMFVPVAFSGVLFRNPLEFLRNDVIIAGIFGILVSAGVFKQLYERSKKGKAKRWAEVLTSLMLLGLFVLVIMNLYTAAYNPFIYFRF